MFFGYIVVVDPKPFASSNSSRFPKIENSTVHAT